MKESSEPLNEHKGEDVEEIVERIPPQEVSEERRIVEQLANFYNWRHKLIELFLNGEAAAEVFTEIYREYRSRIQSINAKRMELIKSLEQKMSELTTRLEQLKVRHEVGEISDRQYITDKLAIDRELSKIKPKLNMLYNAFNVKLADIPDYEEKLRKFKDEIAERGKSLGLSQEDVEMIIEDLDETLESLKGLLELHKKLKKELDKIELRYRIGELTEEEYQAAKQKIERQMQL
ncbi:MAG: CdvA-like protein [Thaumarchaeota archaeon]|nr:CdvA-like protein [Nitrososphaerota archaeon]